jgi:non-heme chloroperoxidase
MRRSSQGTGDLCGLGGNYKPPRFVLVTVKHPAVRRYHRIGVLLLILLALAAYPQNPDIWKDPSPHKTVFVKVEKHVELEVLDWGGTGLPIVLLAGGGDTAHVFDDFAPKLTGRNHVYGITRRGFGLSGYAPGEYGADRLGGDVLAIITFLKMKKPVLVGHSIAGEELSSVATRFPDRVAGVIFLEAAYPYAFNNGSGPNFAQFQRLPTPPKPPSPSGAALDSYGALQMYLQKVNGFRFPEAELRQQWEWTRDKHTLKQRDFPGYTTLMMGMKDYAHIPVPALAIFANPHSLGTWVDNNTDPAIEKAAKVYCASLSTLTSRQEQSFQRGVPSARLVTLPHANHYVYLSNEADVLQAMRTFLRTLH